MKIGEMVRILREAQDLTLPELADLVSVHPVTLAQYERGTRAFPYELPDRIATALGVNPDVFRSDEPWAKIERARTRLDGALADVRALTASRRRKEANSPVFVALPRRQLAFAGARR